MNFDPIILPQFSPVFLEIGFLQIRYYSLAYIAGILIGYFYVKKRLASVAPTSTPKSSSGGADLHSIPKAVFDNIVTYAILGIILGGRLFYVCFYNFSYYLANPMEIPAIWLGGMSFHGGLFGLASAMFLLCRRFKISFLYIMDVIAVIAPIGIFFGRIANFINGELYGKITDVPWAVKYPTEAFARHPSQIYEALLEGLLLFAILWFASKRQFFKKNTGALSGMFLIGYFLARLFVEFFRQPDEQIGYLLGFITMGQILSIPMLLLGVYLIKSGRTSK